MEKVFKKAITTIMLPTIFFGISACATTSNNSIDNDGDSRRVGKVAWNNQVDTDISKMLAEQVANDETRLIFIRKNDNDPEQTSANIAINDRFQVSLHPGNYTAVNSCVGTNQLSAHATGFKDNNLLAEQKDYQLASGQTYFFYVDMDESGQGTLDQITTESALPLLATKRYQTHQISRVVPNCPTPVIAIPPVTQPAPVVEQPAVLTEKMTIELEVLFDTDKSIVKPDYYSKISEVAEFMAQYPNTLVTIEGHTDSRASEKYNQVLSQRRVDAVKEVLITQFGTAPERLNAIGYGELQPRASNNTVEGRQLNRRVIAIIEERPNN
ncbi:OmpA family protein [Psychrobacter sp. M9-54-1]|uniref:OmpA family protein n=1 Tax=Psychrobacter sp. M9-54-1 TaxID=2782386 RepID=UPI00190E15EA|nr:OmpA family protein [Psychrobacter sp. M9-54-1]MBK3393007.1 OmpA family protein [Psychrobacter sp. M9-54-1]